MIEALESRKTFTAILANGKFPESPRALRFLQEASTLVCCDGAAANALRYGREPDYIVGDLDSLSPDLQARFHSKIYCVEEQETNDLNKAYRFCRECNLDNIVILGATGKREDHTLGNLSRLVDFALETPDIHLITDDGEFRAALRPGTFSTTPGSQISIFSFNPDQEISSQGLKYPLERLKLPRWHVATLNEAIGFEFALDFNPQLSPLLLFFAYS